MFTKFTIRVIPFMVYLLAGCGNHMGDELPEIPGSKPPESGSSGGGPSASAVVKRYSTSSGGSFYIRESEGYSVTKSETLKGAAADSSAIYLLTKIYVNYNATQWIIYKIPLGSRSSQIQCNFIDYSSMNGGLAFDGTYFYISASQSQAKFRRFHATNCSEHTQFESTVKTSYDYSPHIAFDSGYFYWPKVGGYWTNDKDALTKISASTTALVSSLSIQAIGAKTTDWSKSSKAITAKAGIAWAAFDSYYDGWNIWKLDDSRALSVGSIPSADLNYRSISFMAATDRNTVVIVRQNRSDYSIEVIYLDMSQF